MELVGEAQEVVVLSRGWRQKKTSCLPHLASYSAKSQPYLFPCTRLPQEILLCMGVHRQESQGATPADAGHSEEVKTATRGVSLHRIPRKK